jgi:hypothetical protein
MMGETLDPEDSAKLITDDRARASLLIFWMKTHGGLKETARQELVGHDGKDLIPQKPACLIILPDNHRDDRPANRPGTGVSQHVA